MTCKHCHQPFQDRALTVLSYELPESAILHHESPFCSWFCAMQYGNRRYGINQMFYHYPLGPDTQAVRFEYRPHGWVLRSV